MKLALAQFDVTVPPHFAGFEARLAEMAAAAKHNHADLLVLPEYAAMVLAGAFISTPDIVGELACVVAQAKDLLRALQRIAAQNNLYILGGTLPMRDPDGKIRNRAPFISRTGTLAFQDKQTMTRFEAERWGVDGGAGPNVFETMFGRIGVSICYDSEFPLHVRAQVTAGATLILVPSCTDTVAGFNRVRLSARARAVENQCIVATSPLVGSAPWSGAIDENHGYAGVYGPPDIFFPANGILARGEMDEPGLVFAEIALDLVAKVRREGGVLNHRDWIDKVPPCPVIKL
ncbi:MAG: carbon-nitrogen hydrolase [Acidocella sp. 20-57-95]|nr:MAG: carbon-nitrogen hydrolase [Acidocella sp. 20-57-95]HQT65175.1 carbon-nitrogen hydrolase family protein [Acidocella sp.]